MRSACCTGTQSSNCMHVSCQKKNMPEIKVGAPHRGQILEAQGNKKDPVAVADSSRIAGSTRVSEPLGFLEQKASKCQVNRYVCRTPPKLKSNLHRVLTVPSKHSAMEKLAFEAQGLVVLIVLGLFILVNFGQCRFRQAFSPVFMLKLVPGIGKIFLLWRSLHLAH